MEAKLGFERFQFIIKTLIKLQAQVAKQDYDISYTGHHIQNRGTTINWSPIGRNALHGDRQQFKAMDKIYGIRRHFLHKFREIMLHHGIYDVTIKLGGDTSFDIYPEGWDKRYALKHFPETDWDVFFVGDRCSPDGNDYEIFEYLNPQGRSFQTDGPEDTIEIIDIHLHRLIGALDDNS
jgi:phosphomannomutase